jgi:hypothetical protein
MPSNYLFRILERCFEAEPIVYLSVYILRPEEQRTVLRDSSCWFCYAIDEVDLETRQRSLIGAL